VGVYRPRRPRTSPLYRLVEGHSRELSLVWDKRFAATCGDWRAVIPKVVDQFLASDLARVHLNLRTPCRTRFRATEWRPVARRSVPGWPP
jgi:hypothetical protein